VGSNYKRHGSIGIDTTQTAFSTAGDASNFNNGLQTVSKKQNKDQNPPMIPKEMV
jgi:hypothetical protein